MKRLLSYLPLYFVVFLILGISFQFFSGIWKFGFLKLFFLIILISFFLLVKRKVLGTLFVFLLFFLIGVSSVYVNDDCNYDNYYQYYITEDTTLFLQIDEVLKPGNFYKKYKAKVIQVDGEVTKGKILLNVLHDSVSKVLKVDDRILLKPQLKKLIPPLNPHQFDYQSYLAKQGIHEQIFTTNNEFLKIDNAKTTLLGLSAKVRTNITETLQKYNFEKNELAVINALLLGQRQDISKALITDYQNAGAIHILAVSGLHVGIILLILNFIFKPLDTLKNGELIKTLVILLLLWAFAFIAGLSASVVRAVTMFSFVAVAMSIKRKGIVEFSFITSLFLLLIVKPMFLFDVGFQLSYLAVFGILWIQPKLYSILQPKNKIVDFFWKLCTVSIAAQVGILPLSIFYFQQFPALFLISNLVIIPFLGVILVGGILVIMTSLFEILPQFVANFYGLTISAMNRFVSWVSHQEAFLFKELAISFWMMMFCYITIFLGIYFLLKKTQKQLLYFLFSIFLVQTLFLYERNKVQHKSEFLVFHKSKHSLLGKRVGKKMYVHNQVGNPLVFDEKILKRYQISEHLKSIEVSDFKNIQTFSNQQILIVDSLGIYKVRGLNNPLVILQHSPKISLERLIQFIKPNQIIVDGSNYKTDIVRWKNIAVQHQVPFHYTGEQGAFVLENTL